MSQSRIIWGDKVNALRLGIACSVKNGASVQLYLKNISQKELYVVDTYLLREHEIAVFTESNQLVPMTSEGKKAIEAACSPFYRRVSKLLEPKAVYQVNPTVYLDQWFELKPAQAYKVCVQRKGWQSDNGTLLSSWTHFCLGV